jgi:hypothetical protein
MGLIFLLSLGFVFGGVELDSFLEQFLNFVVVNGVYGLHDIADVPLVGLVELLVFAFHVSIQRAVT